MATYAAYRHIELDNIGYGKKRVLKPPGGGSSDIFGASEAVEPQRRNRALQQSSSIFEAEPASAAPTQKPGRPYVRDLHMHSHIWTPDHASMKDIFTRPKDVTVDAKQRLAFDEADSVVRNGTKEVNGAVNGQVSEEEFITAVPITPPTPSDNSDEESAPEPKKAEPVANGSDPPAAAPAPASAPASASAAARQRVPPGGFSSGLW